MSISLQYQGRSYSHSRQVQEYRQTYQGFQSELDTYMGTLPDIGTFVSGKGYLTSISKQNQQGPFWNLEVIYSVDHGTDSFSNTSNTIVGRKSAQLSVRNLQLPLERLPNYLWNWNYYLIQKAEKKDDTSIPDWWYTLGKDGDDQLEEIPDEDAKDYKWIKSYSERPDGPDEDGKYWFIVKAPTKPGVEYYDYAYFVVTITAKYKSASAAGNSIGANINTIVTPAQDFNLGGEWKYDEASVHYDGKAWIATQVYTRAGDEEGWDADIYPH